MIPTIRLLLVAGVIAASQSFFNCPEHNGFVWKGYGKCCNSTELPNNCECFDILPTTGFTNSFHHLPKCPEYQNVVFTVFTRYFKTLGVPVKAGSDVNNSIVNANKLTKVIVHGFDDEGTTTWIVKMKNALLDEADANVITVDWSEGAKPPNYDQATANTRVVGSMLSRLIQDLKTYKGVPFGNVHLIGHSLGSHICGYAGKEVHQRTDSKVGRITGLDPAAPNFENFSANVRIDKSDAWFVDIIHTNGEDLSSGGFGTRYSIGHVDFYPNGGKHQPNCQDDESLEIFTAIGIKGGLLRTICSHNIAPVFFINSISICRYDSPGNGTQCTMGYHVNVTCVGDYYPTTKRAAPYC